MSASAIPASRGQGTNKARMIGASRHNTVPRRALKHSERNAFRVTLLAYLDR
jgi:hypothetical protein